MLEVKNLRAGYGAINVLWDVSLDIAPGKLTAIIGPNGAGIASDHGGIAKYFVWRTVGDQFTVIQHGNALAQIADGLDVVLDDQYADAEFDVHVF